MAKFKKLDPQEHVRGLADAARLIQIEELIRAGRMPSPVQLEVAIAETREKYRTEILAARK